MNRQPFFATLAACTAFILLICVSLAPSVQAQDTAAASYGEDMGGATIQQIEDHPDRYVGNRYTVSGEIQEVYGPNAFTIGMGLFGEAMLVVLPTDAKMHGMMSDETPFSEDDIVQVSGMVRSYVVTDLENDYDFDFNFSEMEIDYEGSEPMMVANDVYVSPRGAGGAMGVTLENLEDNPEQYLSSNVVVSGEVNEVYEDGSFTIGGGLFDQEILVLTPSDAKMMGAREGDDSIQESDIVQIEGVVRRYVEADLENDFDFDLDFGETEIEYEESRPAIVAGRVLVTPRGEGMNPNAGQVTEGDTGMTQDSTSTATDSDNN